MDCGLPLVMRFDSVSPMNATRLQEIVSVVRRFTGGRPLSGQYTFDSDSRVISLVDMDAAIESLFSKGWSGCMTLVVGDDEGNAVRCDLLRISRRSSREGRGGKDAHFRTHSFEFEIAADEVRRQPPSDLVSTFSYLAERLGVVFGAAARGRRWLHELILPRGLESGLPGVYPMTAIGHPYVDELDFDAVVSSRTAEVERLPSGGVVISVPDAALMLNVEAKLQEALRRQLGESYFCGPAPAGEWLQRGAQAGIGRLLLGLFLDARADRARQAKRPLPLDYSGVFVDT